MMQMLLFVWWVSCLHSILQVLAYLCLSSSSFSIFFSFYLLLFLVFLSLIPLSSFVIFSTVAANYLQLVSRSNNLLPQKASRSKGSKSSAVGRETKRDKQTRKCLWQENPGRSQRWQTDVSQGMSLCLCLSLTLERGSPEWMRRHLTDRWQSSRWFRRKTRRRDWSLFLVFFLHTLPCLVNVLHQFFVLRTDFVVLLTLLSLDVIIVTLFPVVSIVMQEDRFGWTVFSNLS